MTLRKVKIFVGQTSGAAAIEFAIIVPILMLFLTGITDLGFRFLEQSRLQQITREGAAAAMAGKTVQGVINRIESHQKQLGGPISGGTYPAPNVIEICHCQSAIPPKIEHCRNAPDFEKLATCNGFGPWEIYLEITQTTSYRPILPLGSREINLHSTLRVQLR